MLFVRVYRLGVTMNNVQKLGGVAAAAYTMGIGLGFTVLAPFMTGSLDPVQTVAFLADNRAILYLWNQIILVVFGLVLVVLALALHERLKAGSPAIVQTATAFGLIWAGLVLASGMVFNIGTRTVIDLYGTDPAQAGSVWLAIDAVQDGLGGGNEIVGGVWTLLVSWAALRAGGLPRALNELGVLVGVAGLVTVVPGLEAIGAVFGLGQLIWFAWLGIVMLRTSPGAATYRTTAVST
jgi:hypothetical protein